MKLGKTVKVVLVVAACLVVVVVLGLGLLVANLGRVVKAGVETMGPKLTQAPVKVDDVSVSLLRGRVVLKKLVVGNPEGFKTESAFELDEVRVAVEPKSFFSDRIVIHEILIDGPRITYEVSLHGSNIAAIQKNVEAFAGAGGKPKEAPASAGPGKKVEIDDFRLTNAQIRVSATVLQGNAVSLPMPEVHLTGIGKEGGGKGMGDVMSEIFGAVGRSVVNVVDAAGVLVKKGAEAVGRSGAKAGEAVKEGAGSVVKGVKGLFKKDK